MLSLWRGQWKAGIAIAGMMLFLVLMAWIPVSAVSAHQGASGFAGSGIATVQATPAENPTVTALNEEKLVWDINKDRSDIFWAWTAIGTIVVGLAGVILSLIQFYRNRLEAQDKELKDRQNEREKRAEERFQAAVTGLGDEKDGPKIGAAILLRTFLQPGYEQFYTQTFDLAVAHLRLRRTSPTSEDPDGISHIQEDPNTPLPLTTLSQALIVVFKEAFPRARSKNKESLQSLDASRIQLDNAYLSGADLKQAWMPKASLQNVNLSEADLSEAILSEAMLKKADFMRADLRRAKLIGANLSDVNLFKANLSEADLRGANLILADLSTANLSGADLKEANLVKAILAYAILSRVKLGRANLREAILQYANLREAILQYADLTGADLTGADLTGADLTGADLRKINLENAILKDANLHGVKGLTKEQLEACKAKGTIIDENPTNSSSQSTVALSPPSQSNNVQASSVAPAQESTQIPDAGESNTTSSGPSSQS